MNKSNRIKTIFLISLSSVAIILLFYVNVASVQTTQNDYANYFATFTQSSANLTRAFQDEIALWQLGTISNKTMAELTNSYLANFTKQMNEFNQTESPPVFESAKNSLVNSFNNEINTLQGLNMKFSTASFTQSVIPEPIKRPRFNVISL